MSETRQLVERLRDYVKLNHNHSRRKRCCALAELMVEAADQIEADAARIKKLEAIQDRLDSILRLRADDLTKQACDECEECGQVAMCGYHSVLSELAGHVKVGW